MALRVTRQIVEVLGQDPTPPEIHVAQTPITLTSEVTLGVIKNLSATSTLTLGQTASERSFLNVDAETVLQETELVVDDDLNIIEIIVGLNDAVGLTQVLGKSASSTINLSHAVGNTLLLDGAIALDATSALSLAHTAYASETPESGSTLTLTDSADVLVSKPLTSALSLTDTATVIGVWTRDAETEIELESTAGVLYIPAGGPRLCQYAPIGGPEPTLQGPYPGVTSPFALIYPATGVATDTVELRAPNLGNKDRLSFQRINRETRGGTLIIFADPIWPKIQTLALTFSSLKREEADELLRFMLEHLGQEIRLSDWEQRVWRGIITTPDEPIIQDGKNQFSASFQFEGELTTP